MDMTMIAEGGLTAHEDDPKLFRMIYRLRLGCERLVKLQEIRDIAVISGQLLFLIRHYNLSLSGPSTAPTEGDQQEWDSIVEALSRMLGEEVEGESGSE